MSFVAYYHFSWQCFCLFVCLMVFNATFTYISVISWHSVLLVYPEYPEKTTDHSQVTNKLYHIMLCISSWSRFELTTSVVIRTDCIGSCKSNYHTITATMAPTLFLVKLTTRMFYQWKQCIEELYLIILSLTCSVWTVKLYWLDNVLLYTVTDSNIAFSDTPVTRYLLSFGKLVVNQFTSCWQKISKGAIKG
jgi:hypothetical protein